MKLQYKFTLWLLAFFFTVSAQNPDRTLDGFDVKDGKISIYTNQGEYQIQYYSDDVIENQFVPTEDMAVDESHAVIQQPLELDIEIEKHKTKIIFNTSGIDVHLHKNPFQISFYRGDEYIISEKEGYQPKKEGFDINFNLTETEILMGGGARALSMNRRGHKLKLYNRAHYGYETRSELMNYTLPIVLSSQKYLLHFDNPTTGYLDLDAQYNNTLSYHAISGPKKYQLVAGNDWTTNLSGYTKLTGRQPLPPRWAFGNFSSRFGYHSQEEVLQTVDRFNEKNIPLDAIILDLFWFGKRMKGTMGNLKFHRDSFPEPGKMMQNLEKQGVKTVLITEPFILTSSDRWEEAVEEDVLAKDSIGKPATYDFYFGNTGLIDVFKPKAKTWFWHIYKELKRKGVDGFWGDLGEPEVHPDWVNHVNGSANEVHNIYGHEWTKLIYKGYEKDFPQLRPFILMRAAYSGTQRYGIIPWSGDVNRTWGGLQSQPEISLQMGLQGLAYMHSDLGGFAGNLKDDQLYKRWLQYGVYQPVFRPHAQEELASEPVFRSQDVQDAARISINKRYRLLPYLYTMAFKNSQQGLPLMRPLFFEEPDNSALYKIANQYLWGDHMLISPILERNQRLMRVYLPKSDNWFDPMTNKMIKGGQTLEVDLNAYHDDVPHYYRSDAFIPRAKLVQTTDDYSLETFDLNYYADFSNATSQDYLYHDDGITPEAYQKGKYEILYFKSSQPADDELMIKFNKEIGDQFTSQIKAVEEFKLFNINRMPAEVQVNNQSKDFIYHPEQNQLVINNIKLNQINTKINIKFKQP
jgi:alpha-glucosidase (family GH31 glycosyl hydrolase)